MDHVVAVEEIAEHLLAYARHLDEIGSLAAEGALVEERRELITRILDLLAARIGHDFASYKPSTVVRRIQRRLQVLRLSRLEDYLERLQNDGNELKSLFQDLLIGVTGFFRDAEAFAALEREVVPKLFAEAGQEGRGGIRVWVPGCATGEEAYSIAVLLCEAAQRTTQRRRVQIFATDVNDAALEVARAAAYPLAALEGVPEERVEEFFDCDGTICRVAKKVRETVIFSRHDLIQDPPFSRLDLISCRNLLIYFDRSLQKRVLPLFHFALRTGGYLFLGPAEGVSDTSDLFVPLDRSRRLFRARDTVVRPPIQIPIARHPAPARRGSAARGDEADLDKVFQAAVETMAEVLGAEFAKVLQLEPDGETLLLRAGVGWRQGLVGEARVGAGRGSQAGYTCARPSR